MTVNVQASGTRPFHLLRSAKTKDYTSSIKYSTDLDGLQNALMRDAQSRAEDQEL